MNIVIIDERQGDVITDEIADALATAEVVLKIEADGHVTVENGGVVPTKRLTTTATFFVAPHRDVISAEKSRQADRDREAKLISEQSTQSEDPMIKVRRAFGYKT